jgi:tetratricopeptide (TPR) repeat protein
MNAVHYRRVDNEAEMLRQLEAVPIDAVLAGRGQVLGVIGRLRVGALRATAAIPPFREAVLINPNNAFAQMELAELYRTEGHPEPALAGFVAALLIAPGSIDAHTGIGQVHLTTGREDDAVTAFRRAVALKPDYPDAQYGLASALLRLGRAGDAATPLHAFRSLASRRAAAARASFELFALKRKATIHADEGRYDEAVDAWQAVVAREPANPENHLELGEALVAAGGIATAIDTLEHAMTLGAPADVLRRLAELYAAEGRDEASARARAEYERWQTEALRARFKRH